MSVAFAAIALPRRLMLAMSTLNVLAIGVVGLDPAADSRSALTVLVLWAAGLIATALVGASISADRTDRARALRESQEEIVHRLARVVEFRDSDTGGHVERVSPYSTLIARELGSCLGGRLGWTIAASHPDRVAALGGFHTGRMVTEADDSPHLLAPSVTAEVYWGHADQDQSMTPEDVATLDQAMDRAAVRHTTEL